MKIKEEKPLSVRTSSCHLPQRGRRGNGRLTGKAPLRQDCVLPPPPKGEAWEWEINWESSSPSGLRPATSPKGGGYEWEINWESPSPSGLRPATSPEGGGCGGGIMYINYRWFTLGQTMSADIFLLFYPFTINFRIQFFGITQIDITQFLEQCHARLILWFSKTDKFKIRIGGMKPFNQG